MGQVNQQLNPRGKPCEERLLTLDLGPRARLLLGSLVRGACGGGGWGCLMTGGHDWKWEVWSEAWPEGSGQSWKLPPLDHDSLMSLRACKFYGISTNKHFQGSPVVFIQHHIISEALSCLYCNVSWTKTQSRVRKQNQLVFVPLVII